MLSFNEINNSSEPIAQIKNKREDNILYLTTGDLDNDLSKKLIEMDKSEYESSYETSDEYTSSEEEHEIEQVVKQVIDNNQSRFKSLTLDMYDQRLSLIPSISGSDRIFIAGPTGSGKTSIISQYVKDFVKLFPEKKVYLFSDVDKDPLLDTIPQIIRRKLDKDFLDNPIHTEEIKNSLVIFDDIDSIQAPKILKAVQTLRDSVLRRGRHEDILHVITTSHLLTDYKNTRVVLNEATHIILFPSSGANNSINYILKTYVGLSPKQIPKVKKLKSRWVCFRINFPQLIITENQVLFIDSL